MQVALKKASEDTQLSCAVPKSPFSRLQVLFSMSLGSACVVLLGKSQSKTTGASQGTFTTKRSPMLTLQEMSLSDMLASFPSTGTDADGAKLQRTENPLFLTGPIM